MISSFKKSINKLLFIKTSGLQIVQAFWNDDLVEFQPHKCDKNLPYFIFESDFSKILHTKPRLIKYATKHIIAITDKENRWSFICTSFV